MAVRELAPYAMAPLLRSDSVLLCSSAFTVAYLGAIYLLPSTRISLPASSKLARTAPQSDASTAVPAVDPLVAQPPAADSPPRDRNHPAVIRARLVAVSAASLASCAALPALLAHRDPAAFPTFSSAVPSALRLLGLGIGLGPDRPASLHSAAKLALYPLALTASLFSGSLYISWLAGELPGQLGSRTWASWRQKFDGWRGIRTYLVVSSRGYQGACTGPLVDSLAPEARTGPPDGRDHLPELRHRCRDPSRLVSRKPRLPDTALVRTRYVLASSRTGFCPTTARANNTPISNSARTSRLGNVRGRGQDTASPPPRNPAIQSVRAPLLVREYETLGRVRLTPHVCTPSPRSVSIRVYHHLWLVRRIPVPPNR